MTSRFLFLYYKCSDELILNLFRISQTNQKLKNNNIDNEYDANSTHYNVGKIIRKSIKQLGTTYPEDMPTPKSSIKEIDKDKIDIKENV